MSASQASDHNPLFYAVSSSVRQLYLLLRCISFAPKAQVQLSQEGLRFSVEESSVMEGLAFLDKSLFTTFTYKTSPSSPIDRPSSPSSSDEPQIFEISLPALLETLQIFGLTDPTKSHSLHDPYTSGAMRGASSTTAFDTRVLGMTGLCRLSYDAPGAPLCVILEEAGVTTTCELVTYEPAAMEDIPFERDKLGLKIIMRAASLHDAITELASTSPDRLTLTASPTHPFLALSASGPLGSATVEFEKEKGLLETFQVGRRIVHSYKFGLVSKAARAMAVATKVSIRGDEQGVLSLQFMIELEGGQVSFVDFRFVPLIAEEGEVGVDEGGESTDEEEMRA